MKFTSTVSTVSLLVLAASAQESVSIPSISIPSISIPSISIPSISIPSFSIPTSISIPTAIPTDPAQASAALASLRTDFPGIYSSVINDLPAPAQSFINGLFPSNGAGTTTPAGTDSAGGSGGNAGSAIHVPGLALGLGVAAAGVMGAAILL